MNHQQFGYLDKVEDEDSALYHLGNEFYQLHIRSFVYAGDITFIREMANQFNKTNLIDRLVGCNHKWQQYVGFTDVYKFCQKCNVKVHGH